MTSIAAPLGRECAPGDDRTAGAAFHRIGHSTPQYRWWRPVAGSVVVLAGAVFIVFSAQQVSDQVSDVPGFGRMTRIVFEFAVFAPILLLVLTVTRWIGARPVGTLASVTGRLRLSWLGLCLLIASAVPIPVLVGVILLALATGAETPSPSSTTGAGIPHVAADAAEILVLSLPVLVVLVVVQSATEEVVTRGWFLQAAGGFTRGPWLGIGVQALVFTVMHGLGGTVWGYTDLIVYSIMMGWLTVSTGGIEAAIALHGAWNGFLLVNAVIAVAFLGRDPIDAFGGSMEGTPWQLPVVHLPIVAGYTVVIWWLARRHNAKVSPTQSAATANLVTTP